MLYIRDDLPLKKGETVEGSLLLKKSSKNPRELCIKLSYHLDTSQTKLDGVQCFELS